MKKLAALALVALVVVGLASVASAEHNNPGGGVGFKSFSTKLSKY